MVQMKMLPGACSFWLHQHLHSKLVPAATCATTKLSCILIMKFKLIQGRATSAAALKLIQILELM